MGAETVLTFPCLGSTCAVLVMGDAPHEGHERAAARARRRLEGWHARFSRFSPDSELSRLNADPRATVHVHAKMARFVAAALEAAARTGGLVDPTLVGALERAGYAAHFEGASLPLSDALRRAPARRPAGPSPARAWRDASVDRARRTVTRPPGTHLDSGGIAKGLFADMLAESLAAHESFAIDCGGDLRLGGHGRLERAVRVASPFDQSILHELAMRGGGVATSGIGRRSWLDADGRPAHHLLDPATGRPAYTGLVQVTAVAPSATEAEWRAKAALLCGPAGAARWLVHGAVIVADDGGHTVLEPAYTAATGSSREPPMLVA